MSFAPRETPRASRFRQSPLEVMGELFIGHNPRDRKQAGRSGVCRGRYGAGVDLICGAIDNYRRYRTRVPSAAVELLVAEARVADRRARLLDLGTGTGFVVEALKLHFAEIIAVDADPDMLSAATQDVSPLPGQRIDWVCCRAEEFEPAPGWSPDLITIARAFHCMDADLVLSKLNGFVASEAAVAIMGDGIAGAPEGHWGVPMGDLLRSFVGEPRTNDGYDVDDERDFEAILHQSAFSDFERRVVRFTHSRPILAIVGELHSTTNAAPQVFGSRLAEFDAAATTLLADYASDGIITERYEFEILLARRPT